MDRIQPLVRFLESGAVVIAAAALTGFTAIIIFEVFLRFVLDRSIFWGNEAATYLFVYSVFFGCSVAMSRGELMGIAELRDKLPKPVALMLSALSSLLIMIFAGIASFASWQLWFNAYSRGSISPALEIPMFWIYLPLPLGFALMCFFALNLLGLGLRDIIELRRGNGEVAK